MIAYLLLLSVSLSGSLLANILRHLHSFSSAIDIDEGTAVAAAVLLPSVAFALPCFLPLLSGRTDGRSDNGVLSIRQNEHVLKE